MRPTYPAISHGLLPALTVFADTNNDIEAVVASVQTLTMALRAITDKRERVVLEVVLELSQRPVAPFIHNLFCARKVERFDTASL